MGLGTTVKNAARRHETIAKSLIDASDETLEIKLRAARPTTSGASLFADLTTTTGTTTLGPLKCLWHEATRIPASGDSAQLQLLGKHPTATVIASLKLSDVLIDPLDPLGETYIDMATEVIHRGQVYEVLAKDRSGMAVIAPYVLLVVLKGETRRRA